MEKYDIFFGVQQRYLNSDRKLALKAFSERWFSSIKRSDYKQISAPDGTPFSFLCISFGSSSEYAQKSLEEVTRQLNSEDDFFYFICQFAFTQYVLGDSINRCLTATSQDQQAYLTSAMTWELTDVPGVSSSYPDKNTGVNMLMQPDSGETTETKCTVSTGWTAILMNNPDHMGSEAGELLYNLGTTNYYKAFSMTPAGGYNIITEGDKITTELELITGIKIIESGFPPSLPKKGVIRQKYRSTFKLKGEHAGASEQENLNLVFTPIEHYVSEPVLQPIHTSFDLTVSLLESLTSVITSRIISTYLAQEIKWAIKIFKYTMKYMNYAEHQAADEGFIGMTEFNDQFAKDFEIPLVGVSKMNVKKIQFDQGCQISGKLS